MSGFSGRKVKIEIDGVGTAIGTLSTQGGLQSRSITRNRSEIDVTSDDADGWRTLLKVAGTRSMDLSFSGVMNQDNLKTIVDRFYENQHYTVQITHPDDSVSPGQTLRERGEFFISSIEESAEQSGMVTFSMSLMSSGAITATEIANP